MPSPASKSQYNQLGIGDCGHVVVTWPLIGDLGGRNRRVICDDCTRDKYGLDSADQFIWVRLTSKSPKPFGDAKPKRIPRPKKPKPVDPFIALLQQEGLFDA